MRDKRTKKDVCGEASQRSEIFNFTWKQPEFFQILLQPLTKVVYSTARIIFTFIVFLSSNRIKTLFLLKDRRERALQAVILTEFSLRRLSNLSNRFQCN